MTPAGPPSLSDARSSRNRFFRGTGIGWDLPVAAALGIVLLAGAWVDLGAYRATFGKVAPAFRFVGPPAGDHIGQGEFFYEASTIVRLGNVGVVEQVDPHDRGTRFRWALGPQSTMQIWSARKRARLEFRVHNPAADQTITVAYDGSTLEEIHPAADEVIARQYTVDLRPDMNQFTLTFTQYRRPEANLNYADKRPMAAQLLNLDLYLPDPQNRL